MTSVNTRVGAFTANGSRTSVSYISLLGLNSILLLTPGSLPLPGKPETG